MRQGRWRRLRLLWSGLVGRDRLERDMAEELQFHLDQRVDTLIESGLTRDDAMRRARLEFGAIEAYKDRCRDERGWRLGDELLGDARYAWRMLCKQPGFAIVAIATLAIGIGANAAIFSIVSGVLLRPLPYAEPDRLVTILEGGSQFDGFGSVAYLDFLDWREAATSFTHMAAYVTTDGNVTMDGDAEHARVLWASADLLPTLGITPILGRNITPEEDTPHGPPAALVGYAFWQTQYGGREDIVGRRLKVEAITFTIVGVLPPGFTLRGSDLLLPMAHRDSPIMRSREFHPGIRVLARLRPGVTMDQARTEMTGISAALAARYPATNKGWTSQIRPTLDDFVGDVRPTLYLLLGAVGLVLLIACANVANLLLARAEGRRREFALRAALGASMGRLVRQLVSESVLLSLIGGCGGLLLASAITPALLHRLPVTIPRAADIGIDWRVVTFTFAASLVTGLLFGLAPALHGSRVDLQETLKASARTVVGREGRMRGILVALQLALGLVLLVSTGLLLRTLRQIALVEPGFDIHHVVTMRIGLPALANASPDRIMAFFRETEERIAHMPGVDAAAFTDLVPFSGSDEEIEYWVDAPPVDGSKGRAALMYITTPGFFDALQIRLRAGRRFTWDDSRRSPIPIVIDEVLAQRAFAGQDPIGQTMTLQTLGKAEVIGVAAHLKHWGVSTDDQAKIRDQFYLPYSHLPGGFMTQLTVAGETLVIRSARPPAQLLDAVKAEVRGLGGAQPVYRLQTMEEIAAANIARQRFLAIVLGLFAVIAMSLAGIGVYGVMSYSVSQRVPEFGMRLVLGASARQIVEQVLRRGLRVVLAGLAAGVAASLVATRLLENLLFGVSATDPLTFVSVAALLGAVAVVACAVPALRAVRIEPTTALRQE